MKKRKESLMARERERESIGDVKVERVVQTGTKYTRASFLGSNALYNIDKRKWGLGPLSSSRFS